MEHDHGRALRSFGAGAQDADVAVDFVFEAFAYQVGELGQRFGGGDVSGGNLGAGALTQPLCDVLPDLLLNVRKRRGHAG